MMLIIRGIDATTNPSFANSAKKLPDNIRKELKQCLIDLIKNPKPKKLRLEKLRGNNKPPVYTIHITSNHSHKLSFEINGDIAVLRIVGTHKQIDRNP